MIFKVIKYIKFAVIIFLFAGLLAIITFNMYGSGSGEISFNRDIRPILNSNCTACHGGVKKAGGLSFIYRELALGKGESGKACIVPGDPDRSEFIKRLTSHDKELRMPLGKPELSESQIELLRKWVRDGAQWEEHWAYIKPEAQQVPVLSSSWIKNPIDNFILEKLDEEGLEPSAEADKATLLRRVSLDLIGIPSSTKELEAFVNDKSHDAYEKVVDRLLASPRFGEKWASMWLDLARYADTKGYEKDSDRIIWKYRDWVINAFNEDMPFNQFTIEQLAGDLIPNATQQQIVATAFHRNTPNNDEGGTDDEEFRTAAVIDRINTTFDVWQGVTIGCVQCHSHPYDPIDHKEYYKFMSFLNNTQDADLPDERPLLRISKFTAREEEDLKNGIRKICEMKKVKFEGNENLLTLKRKLQMPHLEAEDSDSLEGIVAADNVLYYSKDTCFFMYKNLDLTNVEDVDISFATMSPKINVEIRIDALDGKMIGKGIMTNTGNYTDFKKFNFRLKPGKGLHDIYFFYTAAVKSRGVGDFDCIDFNTKVQRNINPEEIAAWRKIGLRRSELPVMRELPEDKKRITRVFTRGNWMAKADTVQSGVPAILNEFPKDAQLNRLGMAQWLVSEENPLSARVAVNRYWEQLFGTGIVETLEDFGSQGAKPTHPELLDYLAIKFMKDYQWSMKQMLKFMVMSATYRQSSLTTKEHKEKDPRNKFLAHFPRTRLASEQIRDQALAVSGLLSDKMYGKPVMPHQPEGVWQTVYNASTWKLSAGEDKYRRGVYTFMKRSAPYPSFISFDNPSREFCVLRRIRTNTPLQALATLNDTVYVEAAQHLAVNVNKEVSGDITKKISSAYYKALSRQPSQADLKNLMDLYAKAQNFYTKNPERINLTAGPGPQTKEMASLVIVTNAILNLDEFVNKN